MFNPNEDLYKEFPNISEANAGNKFKESFDTINKNKLNFENISNDDVYNNITKEQTSLGNLNVKNNEFKNENDMYNFVIDTMSDMNEDNENIKDINNTLMKTTQNGNSLNVNTCPTNRLKSKDNSAKNKFNESMRFKTKEGNNPLPKQENKNNRNSNIHNVKKLIPKNTDKDKAKMDSMKNNRTIRSNSVAITEGIIIYTQ